MRLFKRGETWFCWFYAGGRRLKRSTRCHDKRAAEAVARRWEQAAASPADTAKAAATVEDALDALLNLRREQLSAGKRAAATVEYYEQKTGVVVHVLGADTPLMSLTAKRLDAYVSERRLDGASEHTIHKELGALRVALKLAKRRGIWSGDVDEVVPRISPEYKPKERALAYGELRPLLDQLDADHAARLAFVLATTAELSATDRALRSDAKPHEVLIRGEKRDTRYRVVPLVTPWQKGLMEFARIWARGSGDKFFAASGEEWRGALKYAARRAGLEHLSPNDLRRTAATWLRADGAPVELLSPVLGHADGRMAERVYARLSPAALAERLAKATGNWDTGGTERGGLKAPEGTAAARNYLKLAPWPGLEPGTRGLTGQGIVLAMPRDYEGKSRAPGRVAMPVSK